MAPISTNAHQIGKSLRLLQKILRPAAGCPVGTRLGGPNWALRQHYTLPRIVLVNVALDPSLPVPELTTRTASW